MHGTCIRIKTTHLSVAYIRILFGEGGGGEGSTNSVEDRGQSGRGSGGGSPSQGFWRQL